MGSAINFLDHKLKPAVQSDAIDDDFHPLSNLISSDRRALEEGFMAYPVTKPPLEIVFTLHCPIVIHRLKLWVHMGALKTTAVDVYVQNKRGNFDKIGSGESQTAEIFEFVNIRKVAALSEPADSRIAQYTLFPTVGYLLANCSVIKLVIKKTARCVAVLRKIECWGQPARSCSKPVKDSIETMWYKNAHLIEDDFETLSNEAPDTPATDIPEEFLDELTCDIMTIPMILPSGKLVDQMTIEKHNQEEEKWGRQASDPFTSLIYTEMRKPMFNAALKSRIDQFLIKHSDSTKFQQLPRTVGTNLRSMTTNSIHYVSTCVSRKRKLESEHPELDYSCSSLEVAVRKALSTATRYTLSAVDEEQSLNSCHSCMKSLGCFYRIISCKHLICRDCLEAQTQSPSSCKCSCGMRFERKLVEKHHVR
ncbi:RING finger protein 37 [Ochlerotatus camptorhynchus]|uniref:RING finger protein 37 n=1 Tax=Ochlerotatus camptorhynchus TaxID=644619 RepID=UPI0031DB1724